MHLTRFEYENVCILPRGVFFVFSVMVLGASSSWFHGYRALSLGVKRPGARGWPLTICRGLWM